MGSMFSFLTDLNVRIVFIIALTLYAAYDVREGIRRDAELVELKTKVMWIMKQDSKKEGVSNGYEDLF